MSALPLSDLAPEEAAGELVARHDGDREWLDAFAEAFERRRGGHDLGRILRVWGLSRSEAGRLFGVTRQAVAKWLRDGVPIQRAGEVADLSAATDLLVRYLKRDRIPAVVRRQSAALGDRSLIDLWAEGEPRRVLEACREMFTFGDAHA
ncbi:MAG TPA: hypothetical protein VML55_02170 [Planctomycetaceae bacterium]|nr:hypothetical protein [Planctomycetaceae bacterium]